MRAPFPSHDGLEARLMRVCEVVEPGCIADRERRIDYALSPIGGQGQFSCADDRLKVYNSFNSQPFPRILASLSRPLEPLQHAYKVSNTLAKSREESRREGEEVLIMKLSPEPPALAHPWTSEVRLTIYSHPVASNSEIFLCRISDPPSRNQ